MAIHFSDLYVIAGLLNQMSEQEAEHNSARARLAWNLSQKVRGEAEQWEKFYQANESEAVK